MRRFIFSVLVFLLLPTPGVAAQAAPPDATTSGQPTIRDATVAKAYAAKCPGCGHLYTGETVKGAVLLAVGGAALIAMPFSLRAKETQNCYDTIYGYGCEYDAKIDWTPVVALLGVAAASYIYGIIDAGPSADRMNAKNGFQVSTALQVQPTVSWSTNTASIGLRLTLLR